VELPTLANSNTNYYYYYYYFTKTFFKENFRVKETEFFLGILFIFKMDFSKLINNSALGLQN
jgi:hypothetical protein